MAAVAGEYQYDAFGKLQQGDPSATPHLYKGEVGYHHDADLDTGEGTYVVHNRVVTGPRFLSEDPAEDDPNTYRHVRNNPLNQSDPSGLESPRYLRQRLEDAENSAIQHAAEAEAQRRRERLLRSLLTLASGKLAYLQSEAKKIEGERLTNAQSVQDVDKSREDFVNRRKHGFQSISKAEDARRRRLPRQIIELRAEIERLQEDIAATRRYADHMESLAVRDRRDAADFRRQLGAMARRPQAPVAAATRITVNGFDEIRRLFPDIESFGSLKGTRALSKQERDALIESLNGPVALIAAAITTVPVLGDAIDLWSSIMAKDVLTGEDLGTVAITAGIIFAVLPLVNRETGEFLLRLLSQLAKKIREGARVVADSAAVQAVLRLLDGQTGSVYLGSGLGGLQEFFEKGARNAARVGLSKARQIAGYADDDLASVALRHRKAKTLGRKGNVAVIEYEVK